MKGRGKSVSGRLQWPRIPLPAAYVAHRRESRRARRRRGGRGVERFLWDKKYIRTDLGWA